MGRVDKTVAELGPPSPLRTFPRIARSESSIAIYYNIEIKNLAFARFFIYVAELGVEPSLWDYEPHVHRTLSRVC